MQRLDAAYPKGQWPGFRMMDVTSGSIWPVLAAASRLPGMSTSGAQGVTWVSDLRLTTRGPENSWYLQAMGGHSGMPAGPKKCLLLPLPPQEEMTTGQGSIAMDSRSGTGPHGKGDR